MLSAMSSPPAAAFWTMTTSTLGLPICGETVMTLLWYRPILSEGTPEQRSVGGGATAPRTAGNVPVAGAGRTVVD